MGVFLTQLTLAASSQKLLMMAANIFLSRSLGILSLLREKEAMLEHKTVPGPR